LVPDDLKEKLEGTIIARECTDGKSKSKTKSRNQFTDTVTRGNDVIMCH